MPAPYHAQCVDLVAFFLRQFHIGKNGFSTTTVAPRQMVHMPEPSRYAICGYLLFRPETGQVSEEQMRHTNQRQNGSRQAVSDFCVHRFYDEDARAYWQDFQS